LRIRIIRLVFLSLNAAFHPLSHTCVLIIICVFVVCGVGVCSGQWLAGNVASLAPFLDVLAPAPGPAPAPVSGQGEGEGEVVHFSDDAEDGPLPDVVLER